MQSSVSLCSVDPTAWALQQTIETHGGQERYVGLECSHAQVEQRLTNPSRSRFGKLTDVSVPLRNAMNEELRGSYSKDCERVVRRWNKALQQEGVDYEITLPSTRVYRRQGIYTDHHFNREGQLIDESTWNANKDSWLPTDDDRAYVQSLMKPVHEPGKIANWIAKPRRGIHGHDFDFEYVRTDG